MITAFQFVRMGLADAMSKSIWTSPKYGQAWIMKSEKDLLRLYNHIVTLLQQKPGGPYKATCLIFGEDVADRLSRGQGLVKSAVSSGSKQSKRKHDSTIAIDDEDPLMYPADVAPKQKRRK
jgi:hypothetical protein